MPYALDGTIDFYGRYNSIHPVPMTSGTEDKNAKAQAQYLADLKLKCVYGLIMPDELEEDMLYGSTVLLHDYSKQLAQTIIPRVNVNDSLLDVMAECVPMMRTSLIASSGIKGMRVNDADQEQNVSDASRKVQDAAMTGNIYIPFVGAVELQELTNGTVAKSEEYMLAMQSLDNLRLSGYGIDNGGLFQKKAHELQTEADLNGGPVGLVLQDGLSIRQNFCNIVNSIWNVGIWCEPSENIISVDTDGDGSAYERNLGGENTGTDNTSSGGEEDAE